MSLEEGDREISPGIFYRRVYKANDVRVDRFIVKPGVTVPTHGNAGDAGYKLVALSRLRFQIFNDAGELIEDREMAPGEELNRPNGFRHRLVNTSADDFVALKIWPPDSNMA